MYIQGIKEKVEAASVTDQGEKEQDTKGVPRKQEHQSMKKFHCEEDRETSWEEEEENRITQSRGSEKRDEVKEDEGSKKNIL